MTCERCGLDLENLGMYAGFAHCRADIIGKQVPCIELSESEEEAIQEISNYLMERLALTISKLLVSE